MLAGIVSLGLLGTNGIHSVEGANGTCKKTLMDIVVDFFEIIWSRTFVKKSRWYSGNAGFFASLSGNVHLW